MRRLNFDVDTSAKFTRHPERPQSTRALLMLTINKVRARERASAARISYVEVKTSRENEITQESSRPSKIELASPIHALAVNHKYGNYIISTTLFGSDKWIACIGRADGSKITHAGMEKMIIESPPYQAKSMAIADAMITIDELNDFAPY